MAAGARSRSRPTCCTRAADLLIDAVEQELGPIDVLVANHGLAHKATFDEVDAGAWDETMAINLRAPYLLARRVLPSMLDRGFGRILFVSSSPRSPAASSAALRGVQGWPARPDPPPRLARCRGRRHVNAIAPALIEATDMLPDDPGYLSGVVPVGRLGRPAEVATWRWRCCATSTSPAR